MEKYQGKKKKNFEAWTFLFGCCRVRLDLHRFCSVS